MGSQIEMWRVMLLVVLTWAMVASQESETVDIGQAKDRNAAAKAVLQRSLDAGVGGFHKTPNFMVSHRSFKVEVKSREGCRNVCKQHDSCRSFSYRAGDKRCYWPKEALHYDSQFVFYMKMTKMNDMGQMKPTGQYKRFDNFAYKEKGWQKIVASMPGCRDLCNKMDKCGSFSWREKDTLCLLSDSSVRYDTDFDYYERNMPKKKKKVGAKAKIMVLKDSKNKQSMKKTDKVLKKQVKKGIAKLKKMKKAIENPKGTESRAAAKRASSKKQMLADISERRVKSKRTLEIARMGSQTIRVHTVGRRTAKENTRKATAKIHKAFQEGYMKAEEKNSAGFKKAVKENQFKRKDDLEKHTKKVSKEAKKKERIAVEKKNKEKKKKEVTKKAQKKEAKKKAQHKLQSHDITKVEREVMLDDRKKFQNERSLKIILKAQKKRTQREKATKKKLLKEVEKKRQQKIKQEKKDAKERKEKIKHEAGLKEEQK